MTGLILNPEPVDRSMPIIEKGRTVYRTALGVSVFCIGALGFVLATGVEYATHHAGHHLLKALH